MASLPPPVHFTVAAVILAVAAVLLFMLCDWRSRGGGVVFVLGRSSARPLHAPDMAVRQVLLQADGRRFSSWFTTSSDRR